MAVRIILVRVSITLVRVSELVLPTLLLHAFWRAEIVLLLFPQRVAKVEKVLIAGFALDDLLHKIVHDHRLGCIHCV